MKPKIRGYKEGTIIQDLWSLGGGGHRKGDTVRYRLYNKEPDSDGRIYGKPREYHYLNLDNLGLVRTEELLIKEELK